MAATLPRRDGRDHHGGGRIPFSPSASASSRRRRGPSPNDDDDNDGRRPPNAAPATVDPVARLATAKARTIIAKSDTILHLFYAVVNDSLRGERMGMYLRSMVTSYVTLCNTLSTMVIIICGCSEERSPMYVLVGTIPSCT